MNLKNQNDEPSWEKEIILWKSSEGVLCAVLLFAFNLFLRWKDRELSADEYFISAINTLILTAGFVWGDRYRRKNLVNQKKIEEYLKNKENNGF